MDLCKHELDPASCGLCSPRLGAVDLHRQSGPSSASPFGAEVVTTVYANGEAFGLVPSGGTAYVFGTGSVLHHRRECNESGSTPEDRIQKIDDPNGDVWRDVMDPRSVDVPRVVLNLAGVRIAKACGVCALRPTGD